MGHILKNNRKHGFSLFHCNLRSLKKNLSLLNDILLTTEDVPDIIGVSERKLNENTCTNVDIPGYIFLNSNSKTSAGGVGLCVTSDIEFIRRYDLELTAEGLESCWIEIIRKKQKNIIVGCIYRRPFKNLEDFQEILKDC